MKIPTVAKLWRTFQICNHNIFHFRSWHVCLWQYHKRLQWREAVRIFIPSEFTSCANDHAYKRPLRSQYIPRYKYDHIVYILRHAQGTCKLCFDLELYITIVTGLEGSRSLLGFVDKVIWKKQSVQCSCLPGILTIRVQILLKSTFLLLKISGKEARNDVIKNNWVKCCEV